MINEHIIDYLLEELSKSEDLFSNGGLKKICKELIEIEKYVKSAANGKAIGRAPALTYCGDTKIKLCCVPGCNVPTYNKSRLCECHKHEYKNVNAVKLKKMFPAPQRIIPMIGIYGFFWVWLHEYMNKRSVKTGFKAAKQEHRMNRIVQYIAASTILTVDDIETYLMMKPQNSKHFTNKCDFKCGASFKPTQVVDKLLTYEATLTNTFIKGE